MTAAPASTLSPNAKQQYTVPLPASATRNILLLILLADTPNPAVLAESGDYGDIFTKLFESAVELAKTESEGGSDAGDGAYSLTIESYDAVMEQLPTADRVKEADGVLITGSAASAYLDLPWIVSLVNFVQSLPALKPSLKLVGICFGHQIIARAFGPAGSKGVEKNPLGWESGTRRLDLTEAGRALFGEGLVIQQSHSDIISAPPAGFLELASTAVCRYQGMVRLVDPDGPVAPANLAVFTVQGHPEFTAGIMVHVIDAREKAGIFAANFAEESRRAARERHDGVRIARVLLAALGGL